MILRFSRKQRFQFVGLFVLSVVAAVATGWAEGVAAGIVIFMILMVGLALGIRREAREAQVAAGEADDV